MSQRTGYLDPDVVPLWVQQRARRLARGGKSVGEIAVLLRISHDRVRKYLTREPSFQRCPTCGGMVQMPCRICALRACPPPARRLF
jgi:hypothetical protein